MAGKFTFKKFAEIDLRDPFFDSLKEDYPADATNIGFERWFQKKAAADSTALVFDDDEGLGAFVCLKDENEPIELVEGVLSAKPRIKISTLASQSVTVGSGLARVLSVLLFGSGKNPRQRKYM